MKKIGIAGNHLMHANPRFGTNYVNYIQKNYAAGITNGGALPIILPIGAPELASDYIATIDALLLPGGQDVSPDDYGEEPIPQIGEIDPQRDAFEIALIQAAIAADKPIFGICRGAQIINVALGGTLYQDLTTQVPALAVKHDQYPTKWSTPTHHLAWQGSNWLTAHMSKTALVNSFHHQAVKTLATGLQLDATSTDGVIEAFSDEKRRIYGVQWHPEMLLMADENAQLVFDAFISRV